MKVFIGKYSLLLSKKYKLTSASICSALNPEEETMMMRKSSSRNQTISINDVQNFFEKLDIQQQSRRNKAKKNLMEYLKFPFEITWEMEGYGSDKKNLPHGTYERGSELSTYPNPDSLWINNWDHPHANTFTLKSQVLTVRDMQAWSSIILYHTYLPFHTYYSEHLID